MSNLINHAKKEFLILGYIPLDTEQEDDPNKWIQQNILELLEVFSKQGHSGSSAPYVINMFEKLAKFEPVTPLTGEVSEWRHIEKDYFQNIRCGHVFKKDGKAYDSEGIIFYDIVKREDGTEYKSHFTCRDSSIEIKFPYTPTREYKLRIAE